MILHPAAIALLTASLLISLMTLYGSYYGLKILKGWDLSSGSELQLDLEKKTYLVSTLMAYAFAFLIFSLFLFIFTAENLHGLFVGAMCAAGALNVNGFGYPALLLKIANCVAAGLWLIMNYADNRAFDYPLIRKKYGLLVGLTPLVIAETLLQCGYFLNLKANVITSCCGSLFNIDSEGVASGLAALPVEPMMAVFFGIMILTFVSGIHFYLKGSKTGVLFSLAGAAAFPLSVAALVSFISPYIYELPTHHCPFCILQQEYNYAGYLIYTALMGGAIFGAGVGVLMPFRSIQSLREVIPQLQRRMAGASLTLYGLGTVFSIYKIVFTDFKLIGH